MDGKGEEMTMTNVADFTEEQRVLSEKLLAELLDGCHELEEFSSVTVYGLEEDEHTSGILFKIEYADPEGRGNTIFCNY